MQAAPVFLDRDAAVEKACDLIGAADRYEIKRRFYANADEWINVGDSAIVDPNGEFIAGPVRMREEILYADVDPRRMRGPRWMLDVAGHYARPDVFEFVVHREPRPMVRTVEAQRRAEQEPPARSSDGEARTGDFGRDRSEQHLKERSLS